jgi:hypothetical protein
MAPPSQTRPTVKRVFWSFELIRAGTDSQGHKFTPEILRGLVEKFRAGEIPVFAGSFGPGAETVGSVEGLCLVRDRIMATVAIEPKGVDLVAKNPRLELAAGMVGQLGADSKTITAAKLTATCLTEKKVV